MSKHPVLELIKQADRAISAEDFDALMEFYADDAVPLLIASAIALLSKCTRPYAGLGCIAVLVLFFPGNIYAAIHSVGPGGHQWGPVYLLMRTPLQALLIFWGYWFLVRGSGFFNVWRKPAAQ